MIGNKVECQTAATFLNLSDVSATEFQHLNRSYGCMYTANDELIWIPPEGITSPNTSCSSNDQPSSLDCICAKKGKF